MGIQCSLHTASREWRILQPSEQDLLLKLSSEDRKLEGVHTAHVPKETHSATSKSWEQLCLSGPLPPSHRSGHLINVTQHHVLLH